MNQLSPFDGTQRPAPVAPAVNGHDVKSQLTVAIVNNMPDAALRATERQFCALLSAASSRLDVNLKFYSLPGVFRQDEAKSHITRYYEDYATLMDCVPDGLIVTGTAPRASRLRDEAYWDSLERLIEWTEFRAVPSIWSCLAAHAAVLCVDGIRRVALPKKVSGLFDCRLAPQRHAILNGMGTKWRVPHSRLNGLSRNELERNGYSILSWSHEAGVDMFMKNVGALQLFLQGHPEYDADTLAMEYQRDIDRMLRTGGKRLPPVPIGYSKNGLTQKGALPIGVGFDIARFPRHSKPCVPVPKGSAASLWSCATARLFGNWLDYLNNRRVSPALRKTFDGAGDIYFDFGRGSHSPICTEDAAYPRDARANV